jgi:hypothetical protein
MSLRVVLVEFTKMDLAEIRYVRVELHDFIVIAVVTGCSSFRRLRIVVSKCYEMFSEHASPDPNELEGSDSAREHLVAFLLGESELRSIASTSQNIMHHSAEMQNSASQSVCTSTLARLHSLPTPLFRSELVALMPLPRRRLLPCCLTDFIIGIIIGFRLY